MLPDYLKTRFSWKDAFMGLGGLVFILTSCLLTLGVIFIKSASYRAKTDTYASFGDKQVVWLIIAAVVFVVAFHFDYRWLVKHANWIYILGILLLLATALFGTVRNNSRRWLKLGPILFQTSDFMKLAIILYLAKTLSTLDRKNSFWEIIPPIAFTFVPLSLIILQPDLGTSLVFLPILFAMLLCSGAQIKHLVLIIFIGLNLVPIVYQYGFKDYQKKRVQTFLAVFLPGENLSPRDKLTSAYHVEQSKTAIGSGGKFGKGLGKGTHNNYGFLPERHTDFIFAVVGEEWGFMGTSLVLMLYLLLYFSMLLCAYTTLTPSGQLVVVGITALLSTQTIINTCMTIGLAPITGLPLPFLSYGGTSLLFSSICIALVISVKGHQERA